jgi:hypothetical protein
MGRRRQCFEESATYEVYECYKTHVLETDTIPNPHAFWEKVLTKQLGYKMPWGSFQYHMMQLQIRKLIVIDDVTKAVSLPEIELIEKL